MSILLDGTQGIDFNDGSNQSTSATPYARKNLIINGDMQIAQRATSASGLTSSGYHTVDRYEMVTATAGTWTQSQDTDVPTGQGFAKSLKMDCTTADASLASSDYLIIRQKFEGQMLQHLKKGTANAESLTLSFWVKSNKTGTYVAELYEYDNSRHLPKQYTISAADTWEKKTITFDGDTTGAFDNDNLLSLACNFWLVAGTDWTSGSLPSGWASQVVANRAVGQVNLADSTSNYINITGVQLEVGDAASDFEFMPYDMELQRCMRYYEKNILQIIGGRATSTTNIQWISAKWTVEKRANPTIVFYGNSTANSVRSSGGATVTLNSPSIGSQTKGTDYVNVSSGLTSGEFYQAGYTADSEL